MAAKRAGSTLVELMYWGTMGCVVLVFSIMAVVHKAPVHPPKRWSQVRVLATEKSGVVVSYCRYRAVVVRFPKEDGSYTEATFGLDELTWQGKG